ncbi:MAG TPA: hypothetical protein DCQ06_14670, partial [Myxococcales bacterium]|nr:hypothetical protein [Myxococcales bacterium]
VDEVRKETAGFVEIVNFNVLGRQYSTVGDLPTLAVLEQRLSAMRRPAGKPPWVTVPGIDVPFHSTRLRDGVPAFRATLDRLLPETGYVGLVGRYIPNLVAVPFELSLQFVESMVEATGADEVKALRSVFDAKGQLTVPAEQLARKLVVELFAFQFASPVRWIESQDLMFKSVDEGGLGIERLIEIGVGYQPTIANMAHQTLAAMERSVAVMNMEASAGEVLLTDARELPSALPEEQQKAAPQSAASDEQPADEPATEVTQASPAPVAAAPAPVVSASQAAPSDQPLSHLMALRTLLALQAKLRPDQVTGSETIDDVFGGVSSRRNQALVDIGAEFDAGAIDGAHEMPLDALGGILRERAGAWKSPGGYFKKAQDEAIRRVFGRAGLSSTDVSEKLATRYGLGPGLTQGFLNFLSLADRSGESARGGALSTNPGVVAANAGDVEGVLDQLAAAYGLETGVVIAPLGGGDAGGGAAVDAAVVAELQSAVLGPKGVLGGLAEDLQERLRPFGSSETKAGPGEELEELRGQAAALQAEHGEDWLKQVQPAFGPQRHIALTSAWAWARRDVARLYHDLRRGQVSLDDAGEQAARLAKFAGDEVVAQRARYLSKRASDAGDGAVAKVLASIAEGATGAIAALRPSRPHVYLNEAGQRRFEELVDEQPDALERLLDELQPKGQQCHVSVAGDDANAAFWTALSASATTPIDFTKRTALVTGASPGSIAVEVVRHLLRGGARVVVTTSSLRRTRAQFYRDLYQQEAAPGAELHVVPFNQASVQDVASLIDWLFGRVTEPDGANVRELKPPFAPDIIVPFAALGDMATADQLGPRSEAAIRVMLTGVERLVAGIGARYINEGVPAKLAHVVLPLSPNHGGFGGDGAYAETKAGLEVLLNKWRSESDAWAGATSLCAATIGWVRGTGLMDANDGVASDLEARTGARTFSNAEMGWFLACLCSDSLSDFARQAPLEADLTGGFGRIGDVRQVVGSIREDLEREARSHRAFEELRRQLALRLGEVAVEPHPSVVAAPSWPMSDDRVAPGKGSQSQWPVGTGKLTETVVIVGLGEIGPCGSGRTRWALEVQDTLSAAAVLELAWMCGLVRWQDTSRGGGWIDVESEQSVAETEIAERYAQKVRSLAGVRWTEPDMAGFDPDDVPVLATAWLDRDFTFDVASQQEAEAFVAADPDHTRINHADGRWSVTRLTGAEIRVPRQAKINRRVLGMIPSGFSYGRMGVPGDLIEAVDRVTLMNLVATADAFLDAGITPEELLASVHPAHVANTQGSGLGGMQSLRRLFTDHLLDRERQGDIVQEMLINVVAAYAVQSYVGSYGGMVHPVGAC